MNILAISFLYPNSMMPNHGIFVHNRLKAVSKYHPVKVINPIPYFPGSTYFDRYNIYNQVPGIEHFDNVEVYHPRFFTIPKCFKVLDVYSYSKAVYSVVNKYLSNFHFDLIDLHWTYPDLPVGFALKKQYSKKMIVTLRGKEAFHDQDIGVRKKIVKSKLLMADHVISLSSELKDIACKKGVDETKTTVIRNGVDTDSFYYIPQIEARRVSKVDYNTFMILGVGSLICRKGFDRVIRALGRILSKGANIKFYIVGSQGPEGDYRDQLSRLIDNLNLSNHVVFVGNVSHSQLLHWYNSADVFCLSSRGEGSPNVLTEALACGCPSIATSVGSSADILVSEFMGKLISNTSDSIEEGLREMTDRKFDRVKISNFMRKYDWDWCANQVVDVYKQVNND